MFFPFWFISPPMPPHDISLTSSPRGKGLVQERIIQYNSIQYKIIQLQNKNGSRARIPSAPRRCMSVCVGVDCVWIDSARQEGGGGKGG